MKKRFIAVLSVAILIVGLTASTPGLLRPRAVSAAESDKNATGCIGNETTGRCADKCPANTDQGTYSLQGYDKDTGAAVCQFEYYHACPFADSQPADGPVCAKLQAQQHTADQTPAQTPTDPNYFGGK
jgi:hypothetical protein